MKEGNVFTVLSVYANEIGNPEWRCCTHNTMYEGWDTACRLAVRKGKVDSSDLFTEVIKPITLVPPEMESDLMEYLQGIDTNGMSYEEMATIAYEWIAEHWIYPTLSDIDR